MAFNLAERNGIKHPFGDTKTAGRSRLDLFLQRHINTLSVRKPIGSTGPKGLRKSMDNIFTPLQIEYGKFLS